MAPSAHSVLQASQPDAGQQSRTVDDRPRVWPVFVTIAVAFVVLQIAGLVLLSVALQTKGLTLATARPAQMMKVLTQPFTIINSALLGAIVLLTTTAVAAGVLGLDLRLRAPRLSGSYLLLFVTGGLASAVFLDALAGLIFKNFSTFGVLGLMARALGGVSGGTLAAALLVIGLLVGVAEEVFFRGLVQTRLTARWGPMAGVLVTAAAFGFYHGDLVQGPLAFLLGLYLGWMTEAVGSVVPAILVHVLNNVMSVFEMAARVSYGPSTRVVLLLVCGAGVALIVQRIRSDASANDEELDDGSVSQAAPQAWLRQGVRSAAAPQGAPGGDGAPRPAVRVLPDTLKARRLALNSVGAPRAPVKGPGRRIDMTTKTEFDAAAELRFVVRRVDLTPEGLRITDRGGAVRSVAWNDTQSVAVRMLPVDPPWDGQLLADIVVGVEGLREVVRLVGTTPIGLAGAGGRLSGSRLDNVRALVAELAAHNPGIALDPGTDALARSGALPTRFRSMTDFIEYDARYD